jgi:hypothetical protein
MEGITWKDSLKTVFEDFNSADEIDPNGFHDLLRGQGVVVHESIEEDFKALEPEGKKEVIEFLWRLAHQDDLSPEDRLKLYADIAKRHERYFEWEEVGRPGNWWDQIKNIFGSG